MNCIVKNLDKWGTRDQKLEFLVNNDLSGITERINLLPLTNTKKASEIKRAKDYIRTLTDSTEFGEAARFYAAGIVYSYQQLIPAAAGQPPAVPFRFRP